MKIRACWIGLAVASLMNLAAGRGTGAGLPDDYFAEPKNLPYGEELQQQKQEDGWHWQEFRYTSLVYQGEPIRIHAIYALPDAARDGRKLPGILMTHGIFGYSHNQPYWYGIQQYAKGGYAVLFFDWYPDYAAGWKPTKPNEPIPYTTFGKLDYLKPWVNYWLMGNDWKDSLPYQAAMAAKRGVTWLQARPEVDAKRIGVTGPSYGGIFSSMIAGIDPRIKAANPCVYTAGFGKSEAAYNHLPEGWTESQVDSWRTRFDSQVLLAKRSLPILYTVGSADSTFLLTKAMTTFAAMNEPKHLLIGPNRGHEYWDIEQGVLFFDSALKGKFKRPSIRELEMKPSGRTLVASARVAGENLRKIEFYFTGIFEIDPDAGPESVPSGQWTWTALESKVDARHRCVGQWELPLMRPVNPRERLYRWGTQEVRSIEEAQALLEPRTAAADQARGAARVFVRVTDGRGAMECSPISEPVMFADPPSPSPADQAAADSLPAWTGALRIVTNTVTEIHPDATPGKPMARFDGLPNADVGRHGYVLWNWRQQAASPTLTTDGVATPTMKILPPFGDSVRTNAFEGGKPWSANCRGGLVAFKIAGKLDTIGADGRSWHGSVRPGLGGSDAIVIEAKDDLVHLLTVVVPATQAGECNARVSVRGSDGAMATVRYRHSAKSDALFQFRFRGSIDLRVQVTSQPTADQYIVLVGPSAIFLD